MVKGCPSDNSTMPAPMALKLDLENWPDQEMTPMVFGGHLAKGQVHSDPECENVSSSSHATYNYVIIQSFMT